MLTSYLLKPFPPVDALAKIWQGSAEKRSAQMSSPCAGQGLYTGGPWGGPPAPDPTVQGWPLKSGGCHWSALNRHRRLAAPTNRTAMFGPRGGVDGAPNGACAPMGWGHGMRAMGWVEQGAAHFWQGARRVGQGPRLVGQGAPRVGQGAHLTGWARDFWHFKLTYIISYNFISL
jgi:hypothetical protein